MTRYYHLLARNRKTDARKRLTYYPMTHSECLTMRSKQTIHENVDILLVEAAPIKDLICTFCGAYTKGRQWYNRNYGMGLCDACATLIESRMTLEEMTDCYGRKGEHFKIEVVS